MAVGDEKWHFPLLLGGAGVLVFLGMKSSGGSGPTVIGQVAAKDIIAQNTAVNTNDTNLKLAAIGSATSYYNTRQNNDTALKQAALAGSNAQALQTMVIAGQEQLATIQGNTNINLANISSSTALQQAKILGDAQVQVANAQTSAARAASDNVASVAKAQSKNSLWGSIIGSLGSFFTSSLPNLFPSAGGAGSIGNWATSPNLTPNALSIPLVVPSYPGLNQLPGITQPSYPTGPYYGTAFP